MRTILIFMVAFFVSCQNLLAASPEWYRNTHLLPQYCKDRTKGSQSPEFNKWRGTFGEAHLHMHHYCNGLYAEQKARSTINQQERNDWLVSVIGEMQYVGRNCSARCVLYPELHSRLGWALGEKSQFADAIQHYQLAIKAKPKFTKAYAGWSDLYMKLNKPDEARKILESGLKAKPDSRMLQKRLQKLESIQ